MKRSIVLLALILLVVGGSIGCGNTTAFMASGTGLIIQTPVGTIALGNVETSLTDVDAADEAVTVSDTTYFEADASLGAGASGDGVAGLQKHREFKFTLDPVESGTWEDQ